MLERQLLAARSDDERGRLTGASTPEVAERRDGGRVGPVQVVDQENERRLLGDHLGQRLERLDVRELPALLEGELGQDPSQRTARAPPVSRARTIGRGSSERTSSSRRTAASSARVSAVGASPSSSSSSVRKRRYVSRASCWRPSAYSASIAVR